jgi:biopolymer transport protein ExbD
MPLKISEAKDEEGTINLTPMIDIVFLLIIFFMVGTQFTQSETQVEINLPEVSDAKPITNLPDALTVSITADGFIIVDGERKSLTELEKHLRKAKKNYADQAVAVRGDGQGNYQNVMNVLSICHRVGINNITLPARLKKPEES